jgi:hypothetical protein
MHRHEWVDMQRAAQETKPQTQSEQFTLRTIILQCELLDQIHLLREELLKGRP